MWLVNFCKTSFETFIEVQLNNCHYALDATTIYLSISWMTWNFYKSSINRNNGGKLPWNKSKFETYYDLCQKSIDLFGARKIFVL